MIGAVTILLLPLQVWRFAREKNHVLRRPSDRLVHLGCSRRSTMTCRLITTILACVPMILAVRPALAASPNGAGGLMAAYYDGQLFTINFKQEPAGAEQAFQAHNGSINNIYMSDAGLPGGEMFVSVLDAIQGDGLNPLWVEQ